MPEKHSIIFDMDGTLVNTALCTVEACQATAGFFGLPKVDGEIIKGLIGWANPEFYYKMYPDANRDMLLEFGEQVAAMERQIMSKLKGRLLFEGTHELLDALKKMNKRLYIASTGDNLHVTSALTYGGVIHMFDGIHCDEPEKTQMVSRILQSQKPQGFVMVGDKEKDSGAARNNGVLSVGVSYGYGSEKERQAFDHIINHPMELLKIIS